MTKAKASHAPSTMPGVVFARLSSRSRGTAPDSLNRFDLRSDSTAVSSSPPGTTFLEGVPVALHGRVLAARSQKRDRRLDVSVGILVSLAAHLSLVLLSNESEEAVAAFQAPASTVEISVIEMPEFDETPVEVSDSEPTDSAPVEFAPPMQADLPSVVSVDSFVQPMQSPVAAGISTDLGMLVVPPRTQIGQGGNAPKLFEISELDRVPNRLRMAAPNYPQEFRRSRIEGDVVLIVVINELGRVRVDRVVSSTNREFAQAAITAAEQCLYEAPRKGGATVSARYTLKVPFRLNSE